MTRHDAEDDELHGCMPGTREHILDTLDAWAVDDEAPRVYWLNGMAGTGKSTIAHSLCELLDKKGKLGSSFFCSRSDTALRDVKVVIPTIASMLALSSPSIQSKLCQVLENHPDVANLNSLPEQFNLLITGPIESVVPNKINTYKIVVIDAIDECSHQLKVESLIKAICDGVSNIPLKFFISSRPEQWIAKAFRPYVHVARFLRTLPLHDVAEEDVRSDIEIYLRSSLSKIASADDRFQDNLDWPTDHELKALLDRSGRLFIYAATSVRYIRASRGKYRQRLTAMTRPGSSSPLQTGLIDSFYNLIMTEAFHDLESDELLARRELLTTVVSLQTPLSVQGIATLLVTPEHDIRGDLWPFQSVIRVPSDNSGQVSIFHASFRDFIVVPERSKMYSVDAHGGHQLLADKCFQCLNKCLRRNICNLPEDSIGSCPHAINDLSIIPEALRYSCIHWASHLAEAIARSPGHVQTLGFLSEFADEHLLHWFECLSALGELESGIVSLKKAREALSVSGSC